MLLEYTPHEDLAIWKALNKNAEIGIRGLIMSKVSEFYCGEKEDNYEHRRKKLSMEYDFEDFNQIWSEEHFTGKYV